jgi:class 3 adenylate cyclase/tetratricopeptide (TPR) repeat protein
VPVCPRCGHDNASEARFCSACGNPLEAPSAPREFRKTVTVVFSDVTGSTQLGERLDPETLRRIMARYFQEMKLALEAHGGTVEKFIGDAVMAVFGVPVIHEDDALRAVRAAVEMRDRLARLNEELQQDRAVTILTRTGIQTGEVVTGDAATGQTFVTGDAVNVAARLEQAAQPGEILIGEATLRLVRDGVAAEPVPPLVLKGKSDQVSAFRLLEVHAAAEAVRRRLDSPMVGRDRQLGLLRQTFESAVADSACHLFTVIGSPGVGKSRLVQEFVVSVEAGATVLRGRCLPYGEGITYWPVAEMVKQAAGITDDDPAEAGAAKLALLAPVDDHDVIADRLIQTVGLRPASAPAEEIAWAFRKLLEGMAGSRPVVAVFDDIHWAEPTLLDLIDHVADWSRDAPMLLVGIARQELLDVRTGWGGGKRNATTIQLEPLSERECEVLVENLLGLALLPAVAKSRIAEAAEGNPLFVEQVLSMLIDDELLRRDDGHWIPTADLTTIPIPPTIHALLAARLDRLGSEERQVIERASVVGKVFYLGAVSELAPELLRPEVGSHLMTLVRKELIRPDHSDFSRESAFRFRHILIRDAAYNGMPKETRAELHEAFAVWLERLAGARVAEYDEVLGYHLEQAYRYRVELGAVDERARSLADAAARHLAAAGRRALNRSDLSAAASLLGRGAELLRPEDPEWPYVRLDLADTLYSLGEFARAEPMVQELMERARASGDRRLEHRAELVETFRWDSAVPWEERKSVAERAVPVFEELGDEFGLFLAHRQLAATQWTQGRSGEAEPRFRRALEHARRAGAAGHGSFLIHALAGTQVWGPTPVEEGLRRCDELLDDAGGSRFVQGSILTARAALHAMAGRSEEARASAAAARTILEDLGPGLVNTMVFASRVGLGEAVLGNLDRAEEVMRPAVETLLRLGERSFASTLAPQLGRVLALADKLDEAEKLALVGRDTAPSDDWASQMEWRGALAQVMARRGELGQAEQLARASLILTEGSDYLTQIGEAWENLAEVLMRGGRKAEAVAALEEALARYDAKGNVMSAARTQDALVALQ